MSLLGLSHKGAYTSRYQMPEFEQKNNDEFKNGMVGKLVTIQIRLDLLMGIRMSMFVMEGILKGE